MDALVQFLRARLDEGLDQAQSTASALAQNAEAFGVEPAKAAAFAQEMVTAAQARIRLFEETVWPHLGMDGLTGRRAELQARLLAFEHTAHPDYRPEWAPDQG